MIKPVIGRREQDIMTFQLSWRNDGKYPSSILCCPPPPLLIYIWHKHRSRQKLWPHTIDLMLLWHLPDEPVDLGASSETFTSERESAADAI